MGYIGLSVVVASILLSFINGVQTIRGLGKSAALMGKTADQSPLARLLIAKPGLHELWSMTMTSASLVIAGVSIVYALGGMLVGAALVRTYRARIAK